jgi:hypothetical protein
MPDPAPVAQAPCGSAVALAGPGRDPRANRFQAVCLRLYLVYGGVQRPSHELGKVVPPCRGALGVVAGSYHYSCSRATRRAVMPRAV